jgi:hypothetical protein
MPENENRLYLRPRRHLYAHLQINRRMAVNDAQSTGGLTEWIDGNEHAQRHSARGRSESRLLRH